MIDFLSEATNLFEYTQSMRRDLHMHPEIGFTEVRTAGIVAKELQSLGMEVSTGIAKTGVIGLLEGAKPGPVVLLRFDMDALPITEENKTDYISQNRGIMHACGHDGHVAIGLTVARILQAHRDELSGTVKFVFQPAEEGFCGESMGGAEMMVSQGVLDNPKPDLTLALHLWNEKPVGWINVAAGPVMAGAEEFTVLVTGKGGHGATPQLTVDPIVATAQIVTALQSIPSRNVSPLETAVVSVTTIHGGEAFNVIPQKVELKGTIRTFNPRVRKRVLRRFAETIAGVGKALGCQTEVEIKRVAPAVINSQAIAKRVQKTAGQLFPKIKIDTSSYLTMGAEDMAYMQEKVDGCYFFVGSANSEKELDYGHHHPRFDFDEKALPKAAGLMAASAVEFLK